MSVAVVAIVRPSGVSASGGVSPAGPDARPVGVSVARPTATSRSGIDTRIRPAIPSATGKGNRLRRLRKGGAHVTAAAVERADARSDPRDPRDLREPSDPPSAVAIRGAS